MASLREAQRRRRRAGIDQPVVDLVGDELDAEIVRRRDQRAERLRRHHGAARIGRAGDQHAGKRRLRVGALPASPASAHGGSPRRSRSRPASRPSARDQVLVGRIAGRGDRHPVAGIEGAEKGQVEGRRRAGGHHDALGRHVEAVFLAIVARDARPAAPAGPAPRCSGSGRRRPRSAPPPAPSPAPAPPAGRPPCGRPASPACSRSAAARMTSMTMNGWISLRREACGGRLIAAPPCSPPRSCSRPIYRPCPSPAEGRVDPPARAP